MRTNIDNRQAFPAGLVLDLALQLRIRPRVHSATVKAALPVPTPIQPAHAYQILHHDTEVPSLRLIHNQLRCAVKYLPHLFASLATILAGKLAADSNNITLCEKTYHD